MNFTILKHTVIFSFKNTHIKKKLPLVKIFNNLALDGTAYNTYMTTFEDQIIKDLQNMKTLIL